MNAEQLEQIIALWADPRSKLDMTIEGMLRTIPREVLEQYWVYKINRVLMAAQSSPFWKNKLGSHLSITGIRDMEKIPITTRDEINTLIDEGKWHETLSVSPIEVTRIITSGKTGQRSPFKSGMTEPEYSCYVAEVMRLFLRAGARANDTILVVFPGRYIEPDWVRRTILQKHRNIEEYRSNHVAGTIFRDAALRYGMNVVATGLPLLAFKKSPQLAFQEAELILEIYEKTRPRILATSPNMMTNCILPSLERNKVSLSDFGTQIVILGGQKVSTDLLTHLERRTNVHVVSWLESGEVCTIGYSHSDRREDGGFTAFVPAKLSVFFEIVDEEGRQLPIGQRGRLVATRLLTTAQPLIRYFMEDETAFITYDGDILFDPEFVKLI